MDWTRAGAQASAKIMERERQRGKAFDNNVPDASLATTTSVCGRDVATRNTGEFSNVGVETVKPWVAGPR